MIPDMSYNLLESFNQIFEDKGIRNPNAALFETTAVAEAPTEVSDDIETADSVNAEPKPAASSTASEPEDAPSLGGSGDEKEIKKQRSNDSIMIGKALRGVLSNSHNLNLMARYILGRDTEFEATTKQLGKEYTVKCSDNIPDRKYATIDEDSGEILVNMKVVMATCFPQSKRKNLHLNNKGEVEEASATFTGPFIEALLKAVKKIEGFVKNDKSNPTPEEAEAKRQENARKREAKKQQQDQQAKTTDDPQDSSSDDQQGDGSNDQQGDGANKPQGDGSNEPQGNGSNAQQGDGSNEQQGNGSNEPHGDGSTEQQGDGSNAKQGDGSNDQQGDGSNAKQGDGSNTQQGDGSNKPQGDDTIEPPQEDTIEHPQPQNQQQPQPPQNDGDGDGDEPPDEPPDEPTDPDELIAKMNSEYDRKYSPRVADALEQNSNLDDEEKNKWVQGYTNKLAEPYGDEATEDVRNAVATHIDSDIKRKLREIKGSQPQDKNPPDDDGTDPWLDGQPDNKDPKDQNQKPGKDGGDDNGDKGNPKDPDASDGSIKGNWRYAKKHPFKAFGKYVDRQVNTMDNWRNNNVGGVFW